MKYYLLVVALLLPNISLAHDDALPWYQFLSFGVIISIVAIVVMVAGISYYYRPSTIFAVSLSIMVASAGLVGAYYSAVQPAVVAVEVADVLHGVPMTLYRTPDCSCCNMYAQELGQTGAVVEVETLNMQEMQQLKDRYGMEVPQQSCHTTIVDGYVVEGHVPFAAIAQLLDEQPDIEGITLPGMPIGTPGMLGRQTETFRVQTLEGDLFWQS